MSDVYKIGVSIMMANGVSPVLSIIARDLLGVHAKVAEVEKGFGKWKSAIVAAGAAMGAAGLAGAYVSLVEKGATLVHQQKLMLAAGVSNAEVAAATAKSWQLTKQYQNVGPVEALKIIAETRTPYGSTDTAIKNAGAATAMTSIMKSVLGQDKGSEAAAQMFDLVKSAEMRNISMDPVKMTKYFDDVAKVTQAFDGKVAPADFFQFLKYARTNTPYLSERFVTRIAPSLMLEMGSSSAGTALTSFGQAVVAGKMTKRAAEEMIKLGLIDPHSVLKTTSTSTQLKKGAVSNWQLAASDPDLWAQNVLMPAMLKHGIKNMIDQRLEFGVVFGNRTAENFANILGNPESAKRLDKDATMIGQAGGLGAAAALIAEDPVTAMQAFRTQWDALLVSLGSPMVAQATQMLTSLNNAMAPIVEWSSKNPKFGAGIGQIAVVGSVILGVAAGIAAVAAVIGVVTAGPIIATVTGITLLVAGIGTFAALNWKKIVYTWNDGIAGLKEQGKKWVKLGTDVGHWFGGVFGAVAGAISNFIKFLQSIAPAVLRVGKLAADVATANGVGVIGDLWDLTHPKRAPATPPPKQGDTHIHLSSYIGTKKIQEEIIRITAKALSSPQNGTWNSDPRVTPAMPGGPAMGSI